MFNTIRRLLGFSHPEVPVRKRRRRKRVEVHLTGPDALPPIIEGNQETDWDLWQDSVDSQMQSLNSRSMPLRRTSGSSGNTAYDELDPFAKVGKNRDT
jgi:hypothetical protein